MVSEGRAVSNDSRLAFRHQARADTEERFRVMANAAPVMIWIAGPDTGCTFFNQRWLDFTGRSMAEEIGEGWARGVHPDDLARCMSIYLGSFNARKTFQVEYRLRRADGEYRWIYDTGTPLYGSESTFSGYIGSCVDITERKTAEEALRDSEDRYRDLVENSGILFGTHDLAGRILTVNQAVVRFSGGAGPEELVGRNVSDFVAPDMHHLFSAYLETLLREGQASGLMKVVTRTGETRTLEYNNSLRREGLHKPIVRSVGRDVTEERRAKQISRSQTAALVRTLNLLAAEPKLETFLSHVLKAITEELGVPSSALYLYDAEAGMARLHMSYEKGQTWEGGECGHPLASKPFPFPGVNSSWRDLFAGRPMVIDLSKVCASHRNEGLPPEAIQWLLSRGIRTLILIPLMIREQMAGCLSVRISECHLPTREGAELAQALAQQASLALELTRLAEAGQRSTLLQERNRMAQEIHDTLAQGFAGVVLQLEAAEQVLAENPEEARSHIRQARELARENLAEARRSVWALRPQRLVQGGLQAAIKALVMELTQATRTHAEFALQGTPYRLRPEVESNLMRISQEAITNVLKHARAGRLCVGMTFSPHQVELSVKDDGVGFDPRLQGEGHGFGLISMGERTERMGGSLTIHSAAGQGTRIAVVVPVSPNDARE
jgi:PAS domain S-box-containing protein